MARGRDGEELVAVESGRQGSYSHELSSPGQTIAQKHCGDGKIVGRNLCGIFFQGSLPLRLKSMGLLPLASVEKGLSLHFGRFFSPFLHHLVFSSIDWAIKKPTNPDFSINPAPEWALFSLEENNLIAVLNHIVKYFPENYIQLYVAGSLWPDPEKCWALATRCWARSVLMVLVGIENTQGLILHPFKAPTGAWHSVPSRKCSASVQLSSANHTGFW